MGLPFKLLMLQHSELCFGSLPPLCMLANLKNCERTQSKQNLCTAVWELVEMTLILLSSSSQSIKYSTLPRRRSRHSSHRHSQMSTPSVLPHPTLTNTAHCRQPPLTSAAVALAAAAPRLPPPPAAATPRLPPPSRPTNGGSVLSSIRTGCMDIGMDLNDGGCIPGDQIEHKLTINY
jgi:hypothetical protein